MVLAPLRASRGCSSKWPATLQAPPPRRQAYQLLWNDPNASDAVYGSHASSRGDDIKTFSAQQVEDFCRVGAGGGEGGHAHVACAVPPGGSRRSAGPGRRRSCAGVRSSHLPALLSRAAQAQVQLP